ncbi:Hypothetical predicted protein [Octopus vulgaris]|uniref:Transmembrane protein n=1 Tax=Octopus vulgaris TaxID=6645 RepID=A0AA36BF24_OCTVU|nr:Hypothetical predicted protein [Octopus vulgaris]
MGSDRRNVSPLMEGIQLGGAVAAAAGVIYALYTYFSSKESNTTYKETNYTCHTHTTENAYGRVTNRQENNQTKETHTTERVREFSNNLQLENRNSLSRKNKHRK